MKDAFIGFDATLVNENVIEELKKLIPDDKVDGESETEDEPDEDEDDIHELCREGKMPLNELLEKIKDGKNPLIEKLKQQGESSSSGSSQPLSPYLRARRNGSNNNATANTENGECSSNSDNKAVTPQKSDVRASSFHLKRRPQNCINSIIIFIVVFY